MKTHVGIAEKESRYVSRELSCILANEYILITRKRIRQVILKGQSPYECAPAILNEFLGLAQFPGVIRKDHEIHVCTANE